MSAPLVSVLTPVYNGEAYLAECIESVLAQTYAPWRYVIVNNRSTDATAAIAERYAARDERIHVVHNERFVSSGANHNIAWRLVDPRAAYAKMVHADDRLFPECLERMVALAEAHPSVGVVSAYRLRGDRVGLDGLPYPSPVVPGRELCRRSLLGGPYVFGTPTSVMFRASLVRARDPFFDESTLHADEAACYEALRESDFGFVHQVLTFTRVHEGTLTASFADRMESYYAGALLILRRYGPVYLTPEEYRRRVRERLHQYYRCLARALVTGRDRSFWDYHRGVLASVGVPLSVSCLLGGVLGELVDAARSPARALRGLAAVASGASPRRGRA